jgi:hypothetical protein
MKIEHCGHVRMPATDKYQMPSHFPSLSMACQGYLFFSQTLDKPCASISLREQTTSFFYMIAADFATYRLTMMKAYYAFCND